MRRAVYGQGAESVLGKEVGQNHTGGQEQKSETGKQQQVFPELFSGYGLRRFLLEWERIVLLEDFRIPGHGSYNRCQRCLACCVA